jgi:hypothetical protein
MARPPREDAPWLEAAEPEPVQRASVSRRSLYWTLAGIFVLAILAVAGGIALFGKRQSGSTAGYMNAEQAPLITAEPGPYKLPPTDPKGLQVEGQDQTIYAAGEGAGPASQIDTSAVPEEPMPKPDVEGPPRDLLPPAAVGASAPAAAIPPQPAPKPVAPPAIATPRPAEPAKAPPPAAKAEPPKVDPVKAKAAPPPAPAKDSAPKAAGMQPADEPGVMQAPVPGKRPSHTAQIGAYSSPEKAEAAWAAALAKSPGLASRRKQVTEVESGGKTLYRLRAVGADAEGLCAELKAAGLACSVVD